MARKFTAVFIVMTYLIVTLSWLASVNEFFTFMALPGERFYLEVPLLQTPNLPKRK
jgi:hypothetical protein